MNSCRVCGVPNNDQTYLVREMMSGSGEEFEYFICSGCGCLQIASVPSDLAKHYSNGYYSLNEESTQAGLLKRLLKRERARYGIGKTSILGLFAARKYGLPVIYEFARKVRINFTSRILDVGCGKGFFLSKLKDEGFTDLTGIDPYLDTDIKSDGGPNIYKKEIDEVDGEFDFVMLNHSFEHMADPISVLKEIYRLLKRDSYALIRIPVVPSYAWRTYGVNWVQLDAPRHLFLHSVHSMKFLTEKAGFEMQDIVYDSSDFQFWGSELYSRNIALTDYQKSINENPCNSIFSANDLDRFKEKARELNALEDGDQACFYLRKS